MNARCTWFSASILQITQRVLHETISFILRAIVTSWRHHHILLYHSKMQAAITIATAANEMSILGANDTPAVVDDEVLPVTCNQRVTVASTVIFLLPLL